jgi:hypothetical protein
MPVHAMIDIETVSSSPRAAVVAIGAVLFDPRRTDVDRSDTFFAALDYKKLKGVGPSDDDIFHEDPATLAWWEQQDAQVRAKVFAASEGSTAGCTRFEKWLRDSKVAFAWAFPPQFDLVILRHTFKRLGCKWPVHYRDERDARTVMRLGEARSLSFEDLYASTDKHDPVADVIAQARCVQRSLGVLLNLHQGDPFGP